MLTNELPASKYLFGNPTSKATIIEIPQGQLYLVRPLSPKGYSELIFPDANCSIRWTGQQFQYQLVVQRVYEEGEEELAAEEEGQDSDVAGLEGEKDEKTFLLDESIRFTTVTREGGERVFAWRDLSGDPGDLYEFVCDTAIQDSAVANFELAAAECQYERKCRKSRETATEEDLAQFAFEEQSVPSPTSNPRSQPPSIAKPSTPSRVLPTSELNGQAQEPAMAENMRSKVVQTLAPPAVENPASKEILTTEGAELHLFDFESGTFMIQDAEVQATVFEVGNWNYWLQISSKQRDWLGSAVVPDINPVFNFDERCFIFNYYDHDGSPYSWLLRFRDMETEERFQQGLMQALWEHLNETKWRKAQDKEREYALEAFQDLTMEDAPPLEEEEEELEDEEDHEQQEDDRKSEHYDSDESQDDVETQPKGKGKNSGLAVGFKNDRTFVMRGSNIGVFKHDGNKLDFQTNINKVQTPKGKVFNPKKVMLHAEDRDMILQNPESNNSLYRMDLEYGKVVDEYKVHDDIPVKTFAPETVRSFDIFPPSLC